MKLTQGCFSFLPDLTDEQITKQIHYAINKSWAISIEYTDDPHPRNNYWEMWGLPLFALLELLDQIRIFRLEKAKLPLLFSALIPRLNLTRV
jgi:ribulose bisphosphate carboxylase small subunit